MSNSTFDGNRATDAGFGIGGGGIANMGPVTVSNSTFSGNSGVGGGIYNWYYGTLTVSNSTFDGNRATDGGGITNEGTLTVTNSIFSGNSADDGGGIYNWYGYSDREQRHLLWQ